MEHLLETYYNLTITKVKCISNNYTNYGKMKVTSSSVVFSTNITMEVIYCYLETKTEKFFKFHVNLPSYFEISASLFEHDPPISAAL